MFSHPPVDNIQTYKMRGDPQEDTFKDRTLIYRNSLYYTRSDKPEEIVLKLADGWYDFVIPQAPNNIVYLAHSKKHWNETANRKLYSIGNNRGHSSIAPRHNRDHVCFAGEMQFSEGKLVVWTDKSGHYECTKNFRSPKKEEIVARQTSLVLSREGDRLFPMDKFEAWNGRL